MANLTSAAARPSGWLQRGFVSARQLRLPWIPIAIVTAVMVCAIFAPLLAPYDPTDVSLGEAKIPPFESINHLLGTDVLGRDMLSRLIFGARTSATISLTALVIGMVVGTLLGLIAGYGGKWIDTIIMRVTDIMIGFPSILAAMVVIVILGTGVQSVLVAVAATTWPRFCRMIRGEVLAGKGRDYVILARVIGVPPYMIVWRHIFPGVVNTLMAITSLMTAHVILLEASLSFLGLGFPPGAPAWGVMVAEGRQALLEVWWLSLLPGMVITIVVMAFNYFGDWLRDTLDPKLRRV